MEKGCTKIREACENMKKCYINHAKYFGFHSFFNGNILPLAILILVIFILSTASAVITQILYPVKVLGLERFIEYVVYLSMGLTSVSLLVFDRENSRQIAHEVFLVEEETAELTSRLCWHIGSYLMTVAFHTYIICFMFR